jgi:hypothetical protein
MSESKDGPRKPKHYAEVLSRTVAGQSAAAIAVALGATRAQVEYTRRHPSFKADAEAMRSDVIRRSGDRLARASTKAVEALVGLLKDEDSAVRKGAAETILKYALTWRDHTHLAEQIAAMIRAGGPPQASSGHPWS